jgi:hypothetical protein
MRRPGAPILPQVTSDKPGSQEIGARFEQVGAGAAEGGIAGFEEGGEADHHGVFHSSRLGCGKENESFCSRQPCHRVDVSGIPVVLTRFLCASAPLTYECGG